MFFRECSVVPLHDHVFQKFSVVPLHGHVLCLGGPGATYSARGFTNPTAGVIAIPAVWFVPLLKINRQ